MSSAANTSEFVLIGHGSLALACCKVLIERGLQLLAIVSDDEALGRWARSARIPWLRAPDDLGDMAWRGASPMLLSIGNEQLVPASVLERFAHAINFHDGPLPRYAGSHVTSWALMARERTYAVSWHRMTSRADAGDILLQARVPLTPNESALTLNTKCHDTALTSFTLLLEGLVRNEFTGRQQNFARRTFFPRDRRPGNAAILDWNRTADELSALVRALSFGPYVNRLGVPRLWLGRTFVTVGTLDVCAARSTSSAGTLVSVTEDALLVATATHNVRLENFLSLDGRAFSVEQLARMFELREGGTLPACNLNAADGVASQACGWKQEAEWMNNFERLNPVALPLRGSGERGTATAASVLLPTRTGKRLPGWPDAAHFSFVVILAYLARVTGKEVFDIGVRCGKAWNSPIGVGTLLAGCRPFRVCLYLEDSFDRFRQNCLADLAAWRSRKPYLRDAVLRYPQVVRPAGWDDYCSWPLVVDLNVAVADDARHACPLEWRSPRRLTIAAATGEISLVHDGLRQNELDQLSAQLALFAEDCLAKPHAAVSELGLLPEVDHATIRRQAPLVRAAGAPVRACPS
jgi:methionyl-tRNA formyltransferase